MRKPTTDLCILMDTGNTLVFDVEDWQIMRDGEKITNLSITQPSSPKRHMIHVNLTRVIAIWEEK